ncbi:MAG: prolyl oligopeptidase family serine peptidase [Actinobacteria bacterium]|nr:prolyl oligopeptidase family serine peptidase [Actinomycetota bacterium]
MAGCTPPAPSADSFYVPPTTISGANGTIIRSRASVFTMDPVNHTPVAGVQSTQVLYNSTDVHGNKIAVSGTVLVPTAAWTGSGSRPLISYAVGTRGIGQDCAPSYTLTQGADYEETAIDAALNKGFAVAVTDYQGMGTPGGHTYMVGQAMGHAVLDMATAAEQLPGAGLSASTPVGIWGYSEGGAAAGWAAEQASSYAPGLNLKGVSMGGVPADLLAVASQLDGSAFVALELMTAVGYNTAYPDLNLNSYLNSAGQTLMKQLNGVCLVSVDGIKGILGTAFHHVSDYTSSNPLANATWQNDINSNKLGGGKPTVPVFQYHALADEMVQYNQAHTLHETYCAKGVNETWQVYPVAEHATAMLEGQGDALNFLANRFAGLPVISNCWMG